MASSPCFVTTISKNKFAQLEEDLISQGFSLTRPQYTVFSAQKSGLSCVLYTSGKLTVQGKEKEDFILYYLEPTIMESLGYSNPQAAIDTRSRIGIDEAGKGDFFGPLCVAGVQVDENRLKELLAMGVKDSKKLTDPTILNLSRKIKAAFPHSIIRISPVRYNQMHKSFGNLNTLLAWGHATAIDELFVKTGCQLAVVDQFGAESLVERALAKKQITLTLEQRHRAEEDPVVAAASILARATFVEAIDKMSEEYGMQIPKGASSLVIHAAKKLMAKFGVEVLDKCTKTHFKTTEAVIRD